MKIKKAVYMVLGFVGLALGAVGAEVTAASGVFHFCCWQPLALQKVLRNFITGLSERNFTEKIWKALLKAEE